jgi:hypothetical protein
VFTGFVRRGVTDKITKVADELDTHFKLFTEAKNKYAKKARNIKMVRWPACGCGEAVGAVRTALTSGRRRWRV